MLFVAGVLPRMSVHCQTFTPSNTNLKKPKEFPELGSTYKAAQMKSSLWFFAYKSIKLVESNPKDAYSSKKWK